MWCGACSYFPIAVSRCYLAIFLLPSSSSLTYSHRCVSRCYLVAVVLITYLFLGWRTDERIRSPAEKDIAPQDLPHVQCQRLSHHTVSDDGLSDPLIGMHAFADIHLDTVPSQT